MDHRTIECLECISRGELRRDDLVRLLSPVCEAKDRALWAVANQVRRENVGDAVHMRALIEFSSYCRRTCRYCGLRAPNTKLGRYRLAPAAIVETALHAAKLGYRTVVLQSGEDAWYGADKITRVIRQIREQSDIAITLCVGERPTSHYAAWREAGADRYLLRIETSNRDLYSQLHPRMSFDNRMKCLRVLRELGYQLGSGVLVGLPGQKLEHLADDLLFLAELRADMVGIGPFIPHSQTPLADAAQGDVETALRMMALTRLMLPRAHIVATTALGTLDPLGRERGLEAGGNVVMPNVTPKQYRALYEIYPNKICIDESAEKCRGCIDARINSIGRYIATDRGDA